MARGCACQDPGVQCSAMKLVTTAQMRAIEAAAVAGGATWLGLMEQAGWGVAQEALRLLGAARGRRVLVLVGPGNNGGDGLVAARHLRDADAAVTLYLWRRSGADNDVNWRRCRERDIPEYHADDDPDQRALRRLLAESDLIIDALLGMGVSRPVEGQLAAIVAAVNERGRPPDGSSDHEAHPPTSAVRRPPPVIAIDLPTGVHSDSGAVLGSAIRADLTVATGAVKRGLLLWPGRGLAGEIRVADIGLAPALLEDVMTTQLDARYARKLLPARPADAHKGTFGKVMVVAGSYLYPGAATLATAAAARVGAGLVTLATGRSALAGPGRLVEITLRPLPEAELGALGEAAAEEVREHLDGYQALLVGPGLGREKPTRALIEGLLSRAPHRPRGGIGFRIGAAEPPAPEEQKPGELPPTVFDADALNLLSEIAHWWERLPRERCTLTPHPREMQRLLGAAEPPADHAQAASDAAQRWGQIVVLKSATTVIAHPDGRLLLYDGANPALATAGTGDVLAGAIAGLLAQGLAPFDAAALGVYLHGAAGRLVREELGDMGPIASDLLPRLPLAIQALRAEG